MTIAKQGQVIERRWKSGRTFALRVHAYGSRHYITLGAERDGWSRKRAEEELANLAADVRRGKWVPPNGRAKRTGIAEAAPESEPTFHLFASRWLAGRRGEVTERTIAYYEWALSYHLLPYFANHQLSEITIESVDAYRRLKLTQSAERRRTIEAHGKKSDRYKLPRPLSPPTINKTIDVLQAVLEPAVEYGQIARNPAAGKRRRLKPPARRPVYLDTAEQIEVMLEAASQLDSRPVAHTFGRRALIATLIFAGPRASEAAELRWGDVDLEGGRLQVRSSKTQAGLREIILLPILREELQAHKATLVKTGAEDPVFPSASGSRRDKDNIRNRVVEPVVRRANELLAERGRPPLPEGLTPHKLRHTFASVLVACGEDAMSVMAQLGHTDPKFTLRVYGHLMRRDPGEREKLQAFVYRGTDRVRGEKPSPRALED